MRQREAGRILEAIGCAVQRLGHHGKRLHSARADIWRQQQIWKIHRAPFSCRREGAVQAPREYVARPHVVMRRHDQVRRLRLRRYLPGYRGELLDNAIRAERRQHVQLRRVGGRGAAIGQVDDAALARAVDGRVRFVDKAGEIDGMPVVPACLPLVPIHALLHDGPLAIIGHKEAVQV
jgi:hypothetical protein